MCHREHALFHGAFLDVEFRDVARENQLLHFFGHGEDFVDSDASFVPKSGTDAAGILTFGGFVEREFFGNGFAGIFWNCCERLLDLAHEGVGEGGRLFTCFAQAAYQPLANDCVE